jgi:hypothetical protein
MVIAHFTDYAEFKTNVPLLLPTAADNVFLARDGTTVNTGITIVAFDLFGSLVLRCTQMTKPPTLTTDFPKLKFVSDALIV